MSGNEQPTQGSPSPLVKLRLQMAASFTLEQLRTLAFDLHVNFDELPHPGLTPKIRDLIELMRRNGRLQDLLNALTRTRPNSNWPALADLEADTLPDSADPVQPPVTVPTSGERAPSVSPRGVYVGGDAHGDIITGDTYNYYIEGARHYIPEFTTSVENFLYNYLGNAANPVPFGGRSESLTRLEQWRTQEGAPPRLLLTAPAGRGKSALLVRWSVRLQAETDVAVVFMPISIRFNTNEEKETFSLLATRLAHLYDKQIPAEWGNFPASSWRKLVAEYLQEPLPDGRRLLLIVDGLDEAAWQPGADLFPHQLPDRVRLVVSARYRGGEETGPGPWLRQLGWDRFPQMAATMELETLTRSGVRDVLEKMGCPLDELGRDVDIVAELHRLSQGDPLLVELYVRDLWQRGEAVTRLRPKDLRNVQPGYEGYFKKWWEDQERLWGHDDPLDKALVNDVLDVLAIALGPLMLNDLRQLLPEQVRSRELRRAIRPFNRFVMGDGQEQGYVFAHSKLGVYFREGLLEDEQESWQRRFLTWGKQVLADLKAEQIRPHEAPRYLVSYYGRHLEEANVEVEELLPLVSQKWMQVWYEKTGAYAGFLQDVNRVWGRLVAADAEAIHQGQPAPYIGREILCALCQASVNSLAADIPNERLALLLQYRFWTEEQVLAYLRQRRDVKKRAEAYSLLSDYLTAGTRRTVWQGVLDAARQLEDEESQAEVLAIAAPYRPQEVLAMARQMADEWRRADVLAAVVPNLPEENRPMVSEELLTVAQAVGDEWTRAQILAAAAPYRPQETLAAARQIREEWSRASVFQDTAPYLQQETLKSARELEDEGRQAAVLMSLAPYLPEEVLVAAREIGNDWSRADVLVAVAPYLPRERRKGVWQDALAAAQKMIDEWERVRVLSDLAPHLPEEVYEAANKMSVAGSRAVGLAAVAPYLPEERCLALLDGVFTLVVEGGTVWARHDLLLAVVPYLPHKVLDLTRRTGNDSSRAEMLIALAPHVPEGVLAAARELGNGEYRVEVMIAVTEHLPPEKRSSVLEEALTIAWEVYDEGGQSEALVKLTPHLPEELRTPELAEAIAAQEIGDEWEQKELLLAMTPHLPQEALAAARETDDERDRASMLTRVVPHLPKAMQPAILEAILTIARDVDYDPQKQKTILLPLVPELPQEVLAAAGAIRDEWARADVLAAVAPHLPQEVLAAAGKIDDEGSKASVLKALASHLPEEVLKAAREIDDERSRADALAAVALYLPGKMQPAVWEAALMAAQEIDDEGSRAEMLAIVAPHLPEAMQPDLWEDILTTIQAIDDERSRASHLAVVAPHIPEKALAAAWKIGEWSRAEVLVAVAPQLPREALAAAGEIDDETKRAEVLVATAPYLPEETFAAAGELNDGWGRAEVLAAGYAYLPEEMHPAIIEEALAAVREIGDVESKAELLTSVIPSIPEVMRPILTEEALAATREIEDGWNRAELLADLSEQLLFFSTSHLYELWQETLPLLSRRTRPNLLSDIRAWLPVIHRLGGEPAIRAAWQVVRTAATWWP